MMNSKENRTVPFKTLWAKGNLMTVLTLPKKSADLASWFAEGVRAEIAALEKDGGVQTYEVHSGKLIEQKGANEGVFAFIIADGTRIPEDANGRLKVDDIEFSATVIGQQGNIIHIYLEGKAIPPGIHWAKLIIDDTALLRRLAEVLEEHSKNSTNLSSLSSTVFHYNDASINSVPLPETPSLINISGELRGILEKAGGSSVTYIWGPPGTGKTHAIAYLITLLIEAGERVMVTSHTHAAVDQALYEAVKNEIGEKSGPLSNHPAVTDGKVVRIGVTSDRKIPDSVRFDKVLELKGQKIQKQILALETEIQPFIKIIEGSGAILAEWDKLMEFSNRLNIVKKSIQDAVTAQSNAKEAVDKCKNIINQRRDYLEKAKRAWFWRETKVARAQRDLDDARRQLALAEGALSSADQKVEKERQTAQLLEKALKEHNIYCMTLPKRETVEKEVTEITRKLNPLEQKHRLLQDELSQLGQRVIDDAKAIFCTLTKNYVGKDLQSQKFDAVIVDEISMALPPLIFLAAGRASQRVILVGDFLQLPPIVRSDTDISNERLRKDIFHLSGVANGMKPTDPCPVLTRLSTQRRMLPPIAEVARHLVYNKTGHRLHDHKDVENRLSDVWMRFLPENPLVIVDTADLHCWCGKQPGTMSRFNMYTATAAIELASMAARQIDIPSENDPQPIGIITPFTAQRRLLSRLIDDMELVKWVAGGTVHTFQGNQASLIIFDSVLDEPYWSARLCNPKDDVAEVLRDLNVAVTRAKNKFVFIGSSEWLNKHAKPPSALGMLWNYLIEKADLVSVTDILGNAFQQRMRIGSSRQAGTEWSIPKRDDDYKLEILDENTFFDRFAQDIGAAKTSIFGLAPYFGEYRWPKIQPLFSAALARNVAITLVIPPIEEAENPSYVKSVIKNLRDLGAVVISASGLHGKDVIIDERIVYTGSMNWSSNRGRIETIHRIDAPKYAKKCLEFMQVKYIRQAAHHEDGSPRVCPICGEPVHVVNQRRQHGLWDLQAMKIGCSNSKCEGYLRNIDERPPFRNIPRCQLDGRTKYRRVRRGRGEVWQCPKHPKQCSTEKVVPGDPA